MFGVNQSGAEWSPSTLPGVEGSQYTWYNTTTFPILKSQGVSIFRLNFALERLVPNNLTGSFDARYISMLQQNVQAVTSMGSYAMINAHNCLYTSKAHTHNF